MFLPESSYKGPTRIRLRNSRPSFVFAQDGPCLFSGRQVNGQQAPSRQFWFVLGPFRSDPNFLPCASENIATQSDPTFIHINNTEWFGLRWRQLRGSSASLRPSMSSVTQNCPFCMFVFVAATLASLVGLDCIEVAYVAKRKARPCSTKRTTGRQ